MDLCFADRTLPLPSTQRIRHQSRTRRGPRGHGVQLPIIAVTGEVRCYFKCPAIRLIVHLDASGSRGKVNSIARVNFVFELRHRPRLLFQGLEGALDTVVFGACLKDAIVRGFILLDVL
jgi:hypothetical protein